MVPVLRVSKGYKWESWAAKVEKAYAPVVDEKWETTSKIFAIEKVSVN